jgi:NAD(P)-dependent dehydrogenase (short-subunit alcohol dehydrogenase family)
MSQLRFDNRVAIITGAGRGLGRSYALLLASRGAKVVVNDIGGSVAGDGLDSGPAEDVVAEISAAGGEAVACTDTVATPQGGKAIVEAALDSFGSIDILVHNAGIFRPVLFKDMNIDDYNDVIAVHQTGAIHVGHPAFQRMTAAGYGRIVLTSSICGLYGCPYNVSYGVAKTGMIGLNNIIALEGAADNVKSNIILPAAITRMASEWDTSSYPPMTEEQVAPMVGWLSHETCSVSGEMYAAIGGRLAQAFVSETRGVYDPSWTIDEVAAKIDAIRDRSDTVAFPTLPAAHDDHINFSFDTGYRKSQGLETKWK